MPSIVRVAEIQIEPAWPDRVEFRSPDGHAVLVFENPYEWRMGCFGWDARLTMSSVDCVERRKSGGAPRRTKRTVRCDGRLHQVETCAPIENLVAARHPRASWWRRDGGLDAEGKER